MTSIGYHASHEQFGPGDLLRWTIAAEHAGFTGAMCSDHFSPWSETQGHSAFAWSWLGAAMQATSLPFGVVNAPGYRYHPAIIAQAAATLGHMYPDRFWIALGSGEAINEHMTGLRWPTKAERNERLLECATIMRALWAGETVTHRGHVVVEEARLWTLPKQAPLIFGAALSPETAAWLGTWADGLITVNSPSDQLRQIIDAFRQNGGEGKPVALQVHLSYARTLNEAAKQALQEWRYPILPASVGQDLRYPAQFDQVCRFIQPEDMEGFVRISDDPARHLEWLHRDIELGIDRIFLHNVGHNQEEFIATFGEKVLPALR
jgi:coenzyme F420-dependent glucose-6-phosphate dehydrogenase